MEASPFNTVVEVETTVVKALGEENPEAVAKDEEEELTRELAASDEAVEVVEATPSGDTKGGKKASPLRRTDDGGVLPAPQSITNESCSSSSSSSSSSRMLLPVMGMRGVVDRDPNDEALEHKGLKIYEMDAFISSTT